MLINMYAEQARCEKEPRFTEDTPEVVGGEDEPTLAPPPLLDDLISNLYMSKCIAMVIELPYVSFVKEYLQQVSD